MKKTRPFTDCDSDGRRCQTSWVSKWTVAALTPSHTHRHTRRHTVIVQLNEAPPISCTASLSFCRTWRWGRRWSRWRPWAGRAPAGRRVGPWWRPAGTGAWAAATWWRAAWHRSPGWRPWSPSGKWRWSTRWPARCTASWRPASSPHPVFPRCRRPFSSAQCWLHSRSSPAGWCWPEVERNSVSEREESEMRQCEEAVAFSERVCENVSVHLDTEAGHLHPQAVGEGLQASLGDAVGSHVQAGEESEDAGGVDHPTCNTQEHAEKPSQRKKKTGRISADLWWRGPEAGRRWRSWCRRTGWCPACGGSPRWCSTWSRPSRRFRRCSRRPTVLTGSRSRAEEELEENQREEFLSKRSCRKKDSRSESLTET